jgi:large subunit ribosomal protein L17
MNQSSFGRKRDARGLLLRNLAASVILYESVTTTEAKARTVQPIVERLLRIGQSTDKVTARRKLMAYLTDENAVKKILEELTTRFNDRTSGFTRRYRIPVRPGDGAPLAMIQLTKNIHLEAAAQPKKIEKASKATATKEPVEETHE